MNGIKSKQFKEKYMNTRHREINTMLIVMTFSLLLVVSIWGYLKFKELDYEEIKRSEIAQLVKDEGYKKCVYKDSRRFNTIGFGHLIKDNEQFNCISPQQAVLLLREDYRRAENSVTIKYQWADDEVKLVLINMTYQMGSSGVSKFKKTLTYLQQQRYDLAAGELLDSQWASQTPTRAARLAGRIMAIE